MQVALAYGSLTARRTVREEYSRQRANTLNGLRHEGFADNCLSYIYMDFKEGKSHVKY